MSTLTLETAGRGLRLRHSAGIVVYTRHILVQLLSIFSNTRALVIDNKESC